MNMNLLRIANSFFVSFRSLWKQELIRNHRSFVLEEAATGNAEFPRHAQEERNEKEGEIEKRERKNGERAECHLGTRRPFTSGAP